jgi:hypothetical protein
LALLDLFGRDPENSKNLDHYPNDRIHHLRGWWYFRVDRETPEKTFNALKGIDNCILASTNILNCL